MYKQIILARKDLNMLNGKEPEEIGEDGIGRTLTCIGFKPMDADVIDQIGKKYHLWM